MAQAGASRRQHREEARQQHGHDGQEGRETYQASIDGEPLQLTQGHRAQGRQGAQAERGKEQAHEASHHRQEGVLGQHLGRQPTGLTAQGLA